MSATVQAAQTAGAPNHRVSMFAGAGVPKCETCRHYKPSNERNGGWCEHPANRTEPSNGWPTGFTPSVSWDGSCGRHPQRRATGASA